MPPSEDEIRRRLAEFAAHWGGYRGSERAEAQTFLNGLLACYGVDRQGVGARFEERTGGGFMDLFWPGVCIIEMKRPSEAGRLADHREQLLRYWQSSGTPRMPAPRYVVLCAFHRFEVWEPGALYTEPRAAFDLVNLDDNLDALNFLVGRAPVFGGGGAQLTRDAVVLVTDLYRRLQEREAAELPALRDFILQCVWAMFAEDLHMLPSHVFTHIVEELAADPSRSSADDLGRCSRPWEPTGRGRRMARMRIRRTQMARSSIGRRGFTSMPRSSIFSHEQLVTSTGVKSSLRSSVASSRERSDESGSGRSGRTSPPRPTSSRSSSRP